MLDLEKLNRQLDQENRKKTQHHLTSTSGTSVHNDIGELSHGSTNETKQILGFWKDAVVEAVRAAAFVRM